MSRLFGTDGVRGVANKELTPLLAMQLGQAGASVLTKETSHKPTIMVGCDTRISGDMLANALMAGVCSVGANAVYVGIVPTPAVAYLTRKNHMDAGVVISASHNPVEFNGIKFFDANGYKLPDAMEDEIEAIIKNDMKDLAFPTGTRDRKYYIPDGCQRGLCETCNGGDPGRSAWYEDCGRLRGRSILLYFCRGIEAAWCGCGGDPQQSGRYEYQCRLRIHPYGRTHGTSKGREGRCRTGV